MNSLQSGLARLGLTSSSAPTPERAAPVAFEPPPCPDEAAVKYAAGLLGLGAGDAEALRERLDGCIDGTGAGRARWEDGVRRRLDALPSGQARKLEALGLAQSLTSKGVPTWGGRAQAVLDALIGGHAQAWLDAQARDARAAASLSFPEIGAEESDEDYSARVQAWADEIPRGVLMRLAPPSWGDSPDVGGAIRQRTDARRKAAAAIEEQREAAAQAVRKDQIRALVASGASADAIRAAIDAGGWIGAQACDPILGSSAQAWAEGGYRDAIASWRLPIGDAPPQGWATIPRAALLALALPRAFTLDAHPGAVAHLIAISGDGAIVRRPVDGEADIVAIVAGGDLRRFGGVYRLDCLPPVGVVRGSLTPGPTGWAEQQKDGLVWCGPAVFAALTRIQERAQTPGTLDVSRVFSAYDRHPEKRFPRFSFCAWKTWMVVGVDDALGAALDDLKLLQTYCPARIPTAAWLLHAEVRQTQAGGLQVVRRVGTERAALISVSGHASRMGRHGFSGATSTPKEGSSALSASVSGGSNGGGQHASVTVACLMEGRPLLMDSGVGYRLGAAVGAVEKVPGLAEGRPDPATPI